jgi:hypothetical protein
LEANRDNEPKTKLSKIICSQPKYTAKSDRQYRLSPEPRKNIPAAAGPLFAEQLQYPPPRLGQPEIMLIFFQNFNPRITPMIPILMAGPLHRNQSAGL